VQTISHTNFVGKTCFLSFVLVLRLLEQKPTVLYIGSEDSSGEHDSGYYYFSKDGVESDISKIAAMSEDSNVWLLADGRPDMFVSGPLLPSWLVIQASSPKKTLWKKWATHRDACIWLFRPWKWEEIAVAG